MMIEETKQRAAHAAVDALVHAGLKIGLGTGSTAVQALRRIADLCRSGELPNMLFVPTSLEAEIECTQEGMSYTSLNDPRVAGRLDLTIDGADEVDPRGRVIKGMGGAMLREKIVASASDRYAIVVDESKLVDALGTGSVIPLEVVPEARTVVGAALDAMGVEWSLRMAVHKDGPVITDSGNIVLDARVLPPFEPVEIETALNSIPGVVENGVFSRGATDVFVGRSDGEVEHLVFSSDDRPE